MDTYLVTKDKACCCGCGACSAACPTHSITFEADSLGFSFPVVDQETCVHCNKCIDVCQYHHELRTNNASGTFVAKTKDSDTIDNSSSGGLFTELAKEVLSKNGIVYGAAFDHALRVSHIRAVSEKELPLLQKSKYVQSDTEGVFTQVKNDLIAGRTVLFSGTPCQVAGLRCFLGKAYDRLICADVACHGAPGPKDFEICKKYIEKKYGGELLRFDFRTKKRGWTHMCSFVIRDGSGRVGTHIVKPYDLPYYYFFLHGRNFRESCYSCPYASLSRTGDITLADCWNVESLQLSFDTTRGVSLALVNTEQGMSLWNDVAKRLETAGVPSDFPAASNQPFRAPCRMPDNREALLRGVMENGYRDTGSYLSAKEKIRELVKGAIPPRIKSMLRKVAAGKKPCS